MCGENRRWYRLSVVSKQTLFDTDEVMPSVGKLFKLPDAIVRIILSHVSMFKVARNGDFILSRYGIDDFVGLKKFNNINVEISQVKFNQKKSTLIRIGQFYLYPAIT